MSDAYEELKSGAMLYNPWLQMAMGIAGGNSGVNKSEAFSNAMSGGLSAVQRSQDKRFDAAENARKEAQAKREEELYKQATKDAESFKAFATSMAAANPGDTFWQASVIDPKWGLEYFKAQTDADYKRGSLEVDKMKAALYGKSLSMGGGGLGGLGAPDLNLSESDINTLSAYARTQFGAEKWDMLSDDQKLMYLSQAAGYLKKGFPMPPLPDVKSEPSAWKGVQDFFLPPRGTRIGRPETTAKKGFSQPSIGEGWSVEEQ